MRFKILVILYWLRLQLSSSPGSAREIGRLRKRRMARFAGRVLTRSPFYSKYVSAGTPDWSKIPQLSRELFMENFDYINTAGIKLDEAMDFALESERTRDFSGRLKGITVGMSTGTGGKRAIFLVSEKERAMWTAVVLSRVVQPRLFKKQKVAFFLRASSNLYTSVQSSLFEFAYFDIFRPMQDLLTDLENLRPDILAAPPSLLYDISLARRDGRITIEPSQVISFAEVLHDSERRFIGETFSVDIREVYQCTEGFLGVSCSCGTIHLNEDLVLFEKEWIDERHFYPVITDFSRKIQPVVKYRMDDILEVKKDPCECGSPMLAIERITGRDDDVLVFGGRRIYPDLVARRIAQATGDFNSYKIVQVAENRLEVRIDCDPSALNRVQEAIRSALSALFSEQLVANIDFVFKEWIENPQGDKMRKIQRLINEK